MNEILLGRLVSVRRSADIVFENSNIDGTSINSIGINVKDEFKGGSSLHSLENTTSFSIGSPNYSKDSIISENPFYDVYYSEAILRLFELDNAWIKTVDQALPKESIGSFPRSVKKSFVDFETLCRDLSMKDVGNNFPYSLSCTFPFQTNLDRKRRRWSIETQQQKCTSLDKWLNELLNNYNNLPHEAQKLFWDFIFENGDNRVQQHRRETGVDTKKKGQWIEDTATATGSATGSNEATTYPDETQKGTGDDQVRPTREDKTMKDDLAAESKHPVDGSSLPMNFETVNSARQGLDSDPEYRLSLKTLSPFSPIRAPSTSVRSMELLPTDRPVPVDPSPATIINHFLSVNILRHGRIFKANSTKLHNAYRTILRILPLAEILSGDFQDKDRIDLAAYCYFYAQNPPLCINRVFDAYRILRGQLDSLGIYSLEKDGGIRKHSNNKMAISPHNSLNRSTAAADSSKKVFVNAVFPRTYRRSAFGIDLNPSQLQRRVTMLNKWMGALLLIYKHLPDTAQNFVNDFLGLDVDNPADFQSRTILQILLGEFSPIMELTPTRNGGVHPAGQSPSQVKGSGRPSDLMSSVSTSPTHYKERGSFFGWRVSETAVNMEAETTAQLASAHESLKLKHKASLWKKQSIEEGGLFIKYFTVLCKGRLEFYRSEAEHRDNFSPLIIKPIKLWLYDLETDTTSLKTAVKSALLGNEDLSMNDILTAEYDLMHASKHFKFGLSRKTTWSTLSITSQSSSSIQQSNQQPHTSYEFIAQDEKSYKQWIKAITTVMIAYNQIASLAIQEEGDELQMSDEDGGGGDEEEDE